MCVRVRVCVCVRVCVRAYVGEEVKVRVLRCGFESVHQGEGVEVVHVRMAACAS